MHRDEDTGSTFPNRTSRNPMRENCEHEKKNAHTRIRSTSINSLRIWWCEVRLLSPHMFRCFLIYLFFFRFCFCHLVNSFSFACVFVCVRAPTWKCPALNDSMALFGSTFSGFTYTFSSHRHMSTSEPFSLYFSFFHYISRLRVFFSQIFLSIIFLWREPMKQICRINH